MKKVIRPILIITNSRNQALMLIEALRSIFKLIDVKLFIHCIIVNNKISHEENIKNIVTVINSFQDEYLFAFINPGFIVNENLAIISRLKCSDSSKVDFDNLPISEKTEINIEFNTKVPAFNDFFRVLFSKSNSLRFVNTVFVFNSKSKETNDDAKYSLKDKFKVENDVFTLLGNIFQVDLERRIINKGIFDELDVYKKINQ